MTKEKFCKDCGKYFPSTGFHFHEESHKRIKEELDVNGNLTLKHSGDVLKDANDRRDDAKRLHGFKNLKTEEDYLDEVHEMLVKVGLKSADEKMDTLGFTSDFYRFINFGAPRDYRWPVKSDIINAITDMRGDAQAFHTPVDNMYGTPTGGDSWYDFGRVPVSHLMALTSKRIGVGNRVCNGVAHDVFDNRFDIVKYSDREKPITNNPEIDTMFEWMDRIYFWENCVDMLDFDGRTGLGHLTVEKYLKESASPKAWMKHKPKTHPEVFKSFSSYFMTPTTINQVNVLDYNKNDWNFRGGYQGAEVNKSRIYVLEMRREELGLRGLSIPELSWVAYMCYLNIQYYILKAMAQLGVVTIGVQVAQEFPTPTIIQKNLENLDLMRANDFYVLGAGATLLVDNSVSKFGSGINDFMEFLKEDISAGAVFPKNQLFGRSEGGGISGAGAIVTKEDYLASNISCKQLSITSDVKRILVDMCNWKIMEGKTIRFNIDLHKTEEQRLQEGMLREQLAQAEMMTKQAKMNLPLVRRQINLQKEMADVQMEMLKKDPEGFMTMSDDDEANRGEGGAGKSGDAKAKPKSKKDFASDFLVLRYKYAILEQEYEGNAKLMTHIAEGSKHLAKIYNREDFAWRKQISWAKKAK